jgi:hypothetical protein
MNLLLSVVLFFAVADTGLAQPKMGPYNVSQQLYSVPALDASNPQAWVWYPETNDPGLTFPLVAYLHGMFGGNFDIIGYSALFEQIASYGFILIATLSCSTGCHDESKGAPWTDCQSVLPVRPIGRGWGPYFGEGIKLIDWAKNQSVIGEDAVFELINWKAGVGVTGHSMGGQATTIISCAACTEKWNIKAVALHHPAYGTTIDGDLGVNISVPTIGFTSSGDEIWPDTEGIMSANPIKPAAYRNEVGWSHEEPNGRPENGMVWENPYLATFTAAWFQVFLNNDTGVYYDLVFGNSTESLCKHADMVECHVDI